MVCVSPGLSSLAFTRGQSFSGVISSHPLVINPALNWDGIPAITGASFSSDSYFVRSNGGWSCPLQLPELRGFGDLEKQVSLCYGGAGILNITSSLPGIGGADTSMVTLVIQTTTSVLGDLEASVQEGGGSLNVSLVPPADSQGWSAKLEGPWTRVANQSGYTILSLSACFNQPNSVLYNVTASGFPDAAEPTVGWISDDQKFDTRDVRWQLGATDPLHSLSDRGVMSLRPQGGDWLDKSQLALSFDDLAADQGFVDMVVASPLGVIDLRAISKVDSTATVAHGAHSALFLDILAETGDPSLAMQALSTVISQMQYYDHFFMTNLGANVSFATVEPMLIPTPLGGLVGVVVLVAVQLVLLFVVLGFFLGSTEASVLGNAWQAVAQLSGEDTLPLLWVADRMTDREVERLLETEGLNAHEAGVVRARTSGRTVFGPS